MSEELEVRLAAWVCERTGAASAELQLIPGGASRRSYAVRLDDGRRVFLRVDAGGGPLSGTQYNLAREHSFLAPVAATGFPAPRVLEFSAELNAMLMENIDGRTSYQATLPADQQRAMQRELIECVVRLHALSPAALGLPGHAENRTIGAAVRNALATWKSLYAGSVSFKDPAIDFALEWLGHNVPDAEATAVLVHGDVGPGNFLFGDQGRVLALIDWELAHYGHPLEDIAGILGRALGVDFGTAAEIIADYETCTGRPVDRRALDFALVLIIAEWSVGIHRALSRPHAQMDVTMMFVYGHANRYAMLEKLARVFGRPFEPALPVPPVAFELDFAGTHVEESLQEVVLPALSSGFAQHRVKSLLQLERFQKSLRDYGIERYCREDIEQAGALAGRAFASQPEALAWLIERAPAAAREADAAFLDLLIRRVRRERSLLHAAMGPMAQRRIDY